MQHLWKKQEKAAEREENVNEANGAAYDGKSRGQQPVGLMKKLTKHKEHILTVLESEINNSTKNERSIQVIYGEVGVAEGGTDEQESQCGR